jgi:hypothetical protein
VEPWLTRSRADYPLADVAGHDGIDGVIAAVQAQFPGFVFRLGRPVDAHHRPARELGPQDGEAVVVGFDVVVLADDGRIQDVHDFLDRVPAQ